MNKREIEILDLLVKANDLYLHVEVQHPSDIPDWNNSIHTLQRILMCRETRRSNPDLFKT